MVTRKLKQMLQDEGAVSPVIGVILMVAVTVVLGAVIGAFVFGIGDRLGQPAPNAQIDFDYDSSSDNLEIVHDGGSSLTGDNTGLLHIDAVDSTGTDIGFTNPASGNSGWGSKFTTDPSGSGDHSEGAVSSGPVSSGDLIFDSSSDDAAGGSFDSGSTTEVQWESNGGDQSSTLGTFETP